MRNSKNYKRIFLFLSDIFSGGSFISFVGNGGMNRHQDFNKILISKGRDGENAGDIAVVGI